MLQADIIREHALKCHVEVARGKHQKTLTIVAGEVGRDLGLSNRMRNICQTLKGRKLLEMAGLCWLNPKEYRVSASTCFHYAIEDGQPSSGGEPQLEPIRASHSPPSPKRAPAKATNERACSLLPSPDDIVIIACAGSKNRPASKDPNAGYLEMANGKPVLFVAYPEIAPQQSEVEYQRPDDIAPSGLSWREVLDKYNKTYRDTGANPLALLPAWRLYKNSAYGHLVNQLGEDKVFILSAGWGLIPAPFLTPDYDITFTVSAEAYKRRRQKDDWYDDFSILPKDTSHPIHFVGGKDYVPLFLRLTAETDAERVIHHVGYRPSPAPNCRFRRFETNRRTNWHYECAMTLW